jgi:hypothetical protein
VGAKARPRRHVFEFLGILFVFRAIMPELGRLAWCLLGHVGGKRDAWRPPIETPSDSERRYFSFAMILKLV